MGVLSSLSPTEVFRYFEEICGIPRGSGNRDGISEYCVAFAQEKGLDFVRDKADNVIIYKPGTPGYEQADPLILQGHLDMVCQKTEESDIDFDQDGLDIYVENDCVRARGTTLGADNGIAVAMILAILASDQWPHPPLEAVFTTDEEVGMVGAGQLDTSLLQGRRMINLDAEEGDSLTVSCAGGSSVKLMGKIQRKEVEGTRLRCSIQNLQGGHSGVDIDKKRINANLLMGRLLCHVQQQERFDLIQIQGGTKENAIPFQCDADLVAKDNKALEQKLRSYFTVIQEELKDREPDCTLQISVEGTGRFSCLEDGDRQRLLSLLLTTPNGIQEYSAIVEGLVETSLSLGVLQMKEEEVSLQYALRSNKTSALDALEEKMQWFAKSIGYRAECSQRYAPWEYQENSPLRELYQTLYQKMHGQDPQIVAIHAGLECGVFASALKGLDCIAMGPDIWDVHTVGERLSISSVQVTFLLLCRILESCK